MASTSVKPVLDGLETRIVEMMNKYALSGMAVGVVQNGEMVYGKGFGLAEAKNKVPVDTETIFRIASISKTFTAIGIMQLWEQGKFKLDDPVNDYLKTYQVIHPDPYAPPVTFRHMLTHTSGIGEMRDNLDLLKALLVPKLAGEDYKIGQPLPSLAEYYQGLLVPDVYPEVKWAYANNAFGTLGQLIEDISGQPFPEYMLEHVFEPLGMKHSDFLLSERVEDKLAQGYMLKKGFLEEVDFTSFPALGAGSVLSNVEDMCLYISALMNGGKNARGSVLKAETLKKMMSPYYQEDKHLAAMGLGFFIEDLDGHQAVWHGGALAGFNSALWVAPQDNLGVIVFANSATRDIYHFGKGVLRSLLGLPDLKERLPKKEITYSPWLWKDLVGSYGPRKGLNSNARIWLNYGGEVEIYVKNNELMLRTLTGAYKKGLVLYPVDAKDPLAFENVSDGKLLQLAFQRNAEGFIDHLSISALSFYTFYKKPKNQSLRFRIKAALGVLGGLLAGKLLVKLLKKDCKKG